MRIWRYSLDGEEIRRLTIAANDGVVAGAGVIQGLFIAEYSEHIALVAGFAALFAGAFSAGGVAYSEFATERDADRADVAEQHRVASLDPESFRAEIETKAMQRGLSRSLAQQVATELAVLGPQVEDVQDDPEDHPGIAAVLTALAFGLGALIPLIAVILSPDALNEVVLVVSAIFAVGLTSAIAARSAKISIWKTMMRTLLVAALALTVSSIVGFIGHP